MRRDLLADTQNTKTVNNKFQCCFLPESDRPWNKKLSAQTDSYKLKGTHIKFNRWTKEGFRVRLVMYCVTDYEIFIP